MWTVTTSDSITASPSVIDGVVYAGSNDHTLYACDDFTGTILWTASTGDSILAAPALANGMAYVGSADHSLYAFDATTGQTIWTVSTGDRIVSGCAVANGVVYVGSADHKLYACDAATGKVDWSGGFWAPFFLAPPVGGGGGGLGSSQALCLRCYHGQSPLEGSYRGSREFLHQLWSMEWSMLAPLTISCMHFTCLTNAPFPLHAETEKLCSAMLSGVWQATIASD